MPHWEQEFCQYLSAQAFLMLLGSHMPRGVLHLVATCQRVGKPALGIDTRNRQRQRLERDLHFSVVHPIRVHVLLQIKQGRE